MGRRQDQVSNLISKLELDRRGWLKLGVASAVAASLPGTLLRAQSAPQACSAAIPQNHEPSNGGSCPYPIPWLDKNGNHNQIPMPNVELSSIYHFKGKLARCNGFHGMGTDNQGIQNATVYTTLEPCTERKPPKKPCTERLIEGKVKRVVYGMADKHESVYGHSSLVEAGIEIGFFPNDLMPELLALNKRWSDSLRSKQGFPPPNDTSPLANVSYYKPGTSMADNTHFFVRPPWTAGGFFTVEDALKNVLAYGRTLEEIAIEWHRIDDQKVIVEKLIRQSYGSSNRLFSFI